MEDTNKDGTRTRNTDLHRKKIIIPTRKERSQEDSEHRWQEIKEEPTTSPETHVVTSTTLQRLEICVQRKENIHKLLKLTFLFNLPQFSLYIVCKILDFVLFFWIGQAYICTNQRLGRFEAKSKVCQVAVTHEYELSEGANGCKVRHYCFLRKISRR